MKHILFATTALVALGGVSATAADVSITGYTRFTYDSGPDDAVLDPDYNIWVKADEVTDNNLRYGGAVRLTPGTEGDASSSRHYLWFENEMGKVTMGQHHGPAYTMSLGADWRGTVSAAGKSSYNVFQGHTTPRIIYTTPNVSGFQLGTSVSQGTDSLGTETQTGVNYSIPFNDTTITLGHSFSKVDAVMNGAGKMESKETGIQITHGKFTASYLTFDRSKAGTPVTTTTTNLVGTGVTTLIGADTNEKVVGTSSQTNVIGTETFEQVVGTEETQGEIIGYRDETRTEIYFEPKYSFNLCPDLTEDNRKNDDCYEQVEQTREITETVPVYETVTVPIYETVTVPIYETVTVPNYETVVTPIYATNTTYEMVDTTTTSIKDHEDLKGNEIEIAYAVNDELTINLVKFSTENTGLDGKTSEYDRTSIGGKVNLASNLTAHLSHSSIDNNGTDENTTRFRLNYSF